MPVHNRRDHTLQVLGSLARADTAGLHVTTVVVDDGSTDGTSDAVRREFPLTQIIAGDGTWHYTAGTNRGIEAALRQSPDYIVAMNDDSIVHDALLRRLVDCAAAHPRSIVGALLLRWNEPHRVFQVGQTWDTWYGGWRVPQQDDAWSVPQTPFDVETLAGNCVLYPVQAIREVGLMDERRYYCFADLPYTVAMRRAGWRLLVDPTARVWCQPNATPPRLRSLSTAAVLRMFLVDGRHPLNLKRHFVTLWDTAPSGGHAITAFSIYVGRLLLKAAGLGGRWPHWPDPKRSQPRTQACSSGSR